MFAVLLDISAVSPCYLWNYPFWPVTCWLSHTPHSNYPPPFNLLFSHYHYMTGQAAMFLFYFTAFWLLCCHVYRTFISALAYKGCCVTGFLSQADMIQFILPYFGFLLSKSRTLISISIPWHGDNSQGQTKASLAVKITQKNHLWVCINTSSATQSGMQAWTATWLFVDGCGPLQGSLDWGTCWECCGEHEGQELQRQKQD